MRIFKNHGVGSPDHFWSFWMTPKETPVSLESWRIPAPKERAEISISFLLVFSRLWIMRGLAMPLLFSRKAFTSLSPTGLISSVSISSICPSVLWGWRSSAGNPLHPQRYPDGWCLWASRLLPMMPLARHLLSVVHKVIVKRKAMAMYLRCHQH